MKIFVINTGSSSIKFELFEMDGQKVLFKGAVERIGEESSEIKFWSHHQAETKQLLEKIPDHQSGLGRVVDLLTHQYDGVIRSAAEIQAVGHRVVHGGESYSNASVIDDKLKDKVRDLIALAPLHNPPNLQGIEVAEACFTEAVQVAVFDTAFHQTMPPRSYRFPLPAKYYETDQIRAYGFHGTSHSYVSKQMLGLLDKADEQTRLITIHLGNGCSMAAIEGGRCVDTSMGISPLGGLMMGTRPGDIDPALNGYLMVKLGMSKTEIDRLMNKESGLKGVAGSNDMRDVLHKRSAGDKEAKLAVDMYVQRIKKFIGAYTAEMGGLDAIVFTAGIGENSDEIRALVCKNMEVLGIELHEEKNGKRSVGNRSIHAEGSKVEVWVIPTNEELEIALQTEQVLASGQQAKA